MPPSLRPFTWLQLLSLSCFSCFSVSAGGDIGWPNSNRLVLSVYSYSYNERAQIYVNWPVVSPDRLVSLEVIADPERTVCPAVSRVNRTVTERPEMTLSGLEKNCTYVVTVTVRTRFNELGLSEVRNISTMVLPDGDLRVRNMPDDENARPVLSQIFQVEGSNLCQSEPPLLALNTPIMLSEKDNNIDVIGITLPKKLYNSLQPFDFEVGRTHGILPPQNIDWVVAPISKTELSTILKYRPPATNAALLKNFTFIILEEGAEKERIIVNVSDEVFRQMDDKVSVTNDQVLQSQTDETVFLNVTLKSRLSQGKNLELKVFTNGDEVRSDIFTLKPPIFDPMRFWVTSIKSVKSTAISFGWRTPIFGAEDFLRVILKARSIGGESEERHIPASNYRGELEGLQPWTNYSITITAVYTHGSYEKKMGMYRTGVDDTELSFKQSVRLTTSLSAPPAPDVVNATVTGPGIINASWSPVTTFRGKKLYYQAVCEDADWKFYDRYGGLDTTSTIFKRLSDCTEYKCKVTAVAVGPHQIRVQFARQFSTEGVTVSWVQALVRCSLLEYTIQVKPVQQPQSIVLVMKYPSNVTKALISGLEVNTHYEVRVRYDVLPDRDGNGGGVGEFSVAKQFWTWPQAPSQPTDVAARAINSTAIRVSWNQPDRLGGIISAYTIYVNFPLLNGTVVSRNLTLAVKENDSSLFLVVDELPSETIIRVAIRATTNASSRGEGGGQGKASVIASVVTASGK
ncbi:unnamed protein product [Schistocephalus solidus]|uniref:Protein-tyrosine-phosphatase n=1 Tax=Schistocephalus solidus TaxID=70667 RepID=A0A183TAV5_SCHSO|nr:unnamed protein product [Schistocephalus solidus]